MAERIRFDNNDKDVQDYATKAKQRSTKTKYLTVPVVAGELALIIAVLIGLFMFYQLKYTGITSAKAQDDALSSLQENWASGETTPGHEVPGDAVAILRVQKFDNGKDYPVLFGVDQDILAKAPGLYPSTQQFGKKGNTSIAAHRDGFNAPFSNIDALNTCDVIEVETRKSVYTYKVPSSKPDKQQRTEENKKCFNSQQARALDNEEYSSMQGHSVVEPDKTDVLWPVPSVNRNSNDANLSIITLTSCHPHWSNAQRYIVHAVNTDIKRKK